MRVKAEAVAIKSVLESFALVSDVGAKAQRAALKDTGRNARKRAVKNVTGRLRIAQKVLRKRIQVFMQRAKKTHLAQGRLWTGAGRPPTAAAHPSVLSALRRRHPGGRQIRRPQYGNRVSWMTRRHAGLREERLEFDRAELGNELESGVRDALRDVYPKRLRGQFQRLVKQKIVGRARGVRNRRR